MEKKLIFAVTFFLLVTGSVIALTIILLKNLYELSQIGKLSLYPVILGFVIGISIGILLLLLARATIKRKFKSR